MTNPTTVSTASPIPATPKRPAAAPGTPRYRRPAFARITAYIVGIGVWFLLGIIGDRIPGPVETITMLVREIAEGEVLTNFLITNVRFLSGVAIAVVVGITIGLIAGRSPFTRALFGDAILVSLSIPAIIWAFLSTMWFGFSPMAAVTTAALATMPYIAVNVTKGVQGVSRDLRDMSSAYGVSGPRRIRHMLLPAVSGYVIAGLRIGLIIGWNGVLLSEWFGGADGVGFRARYWYDGSNFAGFAAWVILFVLYVVVVDRFILLPVSKRLLAWRDSAAGTAGA